MSPRWMPLMLFAWCLLQTVGCGRGEPASATTTSTAATAAGPEGASPAVRRGIAELRPAQVRITSQAEGKGERGFVFLIGENHASVKTQVDIADLSMRLFGTGAVDAMLMEGNNGPIEFAAVDKAEGTSLEEHLRGTSLSKDSLHAYWKEELQWGHIAAYEYVKLVRPETVVHGVEDMEAKARFAAKAFALGDDDIKRQSEADQRGVALVDSALSQLGSRVDAAAVSELNKLRSAYQDAVAAALKAYKDYAVASQPSEELVSLAVERVRIFERYRKLQKEVEPTQSEYDQKVAAYKAALKPYESDFANVQSLLASAQRGDAAAVTKLETLEAVVMRLKPEKKELEQLRGKLEAYDALHGKDFKQISDGVERIASRTKVLNAPGRLAAEKLVGKQEAQRAAFAALANALRDAAEPSGLKFDSIESYYSDEAARARAAAEDNKLDLEERDAAMVANTEAFFKNRPNVKSVVLIIGSHHLAGMTRRLRAAGFDLVAGKMTAADAELEPWEEDEWNQREAVYDRFFSRARKNPLTRFANPDWTKEQAAIAQSMPALGAQGSGFRESDGALAGGAKLYVRDDGKASVYVTAEARNPAAHYGAHVVRLGPVPGKPNHHYVAYDRVAAADQIKDLNGGATVFAHHYKENGKYVVQTSGGPLDLKAFAASAPSLPGGAKPRRVILSGEPDEVQRGGVKVSPLWEHLRSATGDGGAGQGPPRGPRWTDAFDAQPSKGQPDPAKKGPRAQTSNPVARTQILVTLNPVRAKKNAAELDAKPARGPIAYLDQQSLERLHFTGPNGEHAQTVVIVAKNVSEFRTAIKQAAKANKLRGKQVALITCGDAFEATNELKEMMLDSGALMVWVPDRQVTPAAASKLVARIQQATAGKPADLARGDITEVINEALGVWHGEDPKDADLQSFLMARGWVLLEDPDSAGWSLPSEAARSLLSTRRT